MTHIFSGFFQFGYVTRELDAAIAAYRQRFGAIEFLINAPDPIDGVAPPTRRIALAYIDAVMIELIEPDPAQATIYDDALPTRTGDIALHHFGYLIDDHEAMVARLQERGYAMPLAGSVPGALDYIYADTRAHLGHYSEFICLDEGGRAFFGAVPRLRTGKQP
ncbi:hypothetical protein FHS96_003868 [Sphingomonas zeicaulis]|uniref:VOC family protein n=1 Tax=Sphingomonas zeicaulis TaxID=1632740 RepID=UPI003D239C64